MMHLALVRQLPWPHHNWAAHRRSWGHWSAQAGVGITDRGLARRLVETPSHQPDRRTVSFLLGQVAVVAWAAAPVAYG